MPIYLKDRRYFATRKTKAITVICTTLVLIYGAINLRVGKVEVVNELIDMKTFVQKYFPGGLFLNDEINIPDTLNSVHFTDITVSTCEEYYKKAIKENGYPATVTLSSDGHEIYLADLECFNYKGGISFRPNTEVIKAYILAN